MCLAVIIYGSLDDWPKAFAIRSPVPSHLPLGRGGGRPKAHEPRRDRESSCLHPFIFTPKLLGPHYTLNHVGRGEDQGD